MNISDSSVVLSMDVTDDIWLKVKALVSGHDDIELIVKNVNINLKIIDIPKEISSITLESCVFQFNTELSGLKHGRYLQIKNCSRRNFFLGTLSLVNIECMHFLYTEDKPKYKNIDHTKYLALNIENCTFDYFSYTSVDAPTFSNVRFVKKLNYYSHAIHKEETLFFENCIFNDFLVIQISNINRLSLDMSKCQIIPTQKNFKPLVSLLVDDVVLKTLNISNSSLGNMNFNFFRKEIEKIDINNSQIKCLELYTVDDVDTPKRIYSISIIDSHIDKLLLNNRHIVHSLFFDGSTFNNPPQMFGANMPHGSSLPNKEGFISRNGDSDASCYRILRNFMEMERNRELEGQFFVLEQESLLNKHNGFKKYLSVNYMYYIFSNYGTDYIRPLLLLTLSIFFFTIIYSLLLSPQISPNLPIDWLIIKNSLVFTLKQTFQPFISLRDMAPLLDENNPLEIKYIFIGVINSIVSVTCLTLSALAIRWKFKRG